MTMGYDFRPLDTMNNSGWWLARKTLGVELRSL